MARLIKLTRRCLANEQGASAVEYGLICALIILAMLSALQGVATENTRIWNQVKTAQANAVSGTS